MIGIYKITDRESGKCYVGQSRNIGPRLQLHLWDFEKNNGINKYHPELKIENLIFEIIELCKEEELDAREQYWIARFDSFWNGFNRTLGGTKMSEEEKELIRTDKHPYRKTNRPDVVNRKIIKEFFKEKNGVILTKEMKDEWVKQLKELGVRNNKYEKDFSFSFVIQRCREYGICDFDKVKANKKDCAANPDLIRNKTYIKIRMLEE